jgi:hypothetical protein
MGNRYDDERYGRGHRPDDDRGPYASESRHERDWNPDNDPEGMRHRELQGRDAQSHEDQRRWQQSRSPWPDYSSPRGQMGYEGNRPRVQTLPEWRGGFDQAREDTRRRLDQREYGPRDQGWQGRDRSEGSYSRSREEFDRGRLATGQGSGSHRYGNYGSGGYGPGGYGRAPAAGTPDYPGYSGLYSGYGGSGEAGDPRREWRTDDREPRHEGWEGDRDPWRSGTSGHEARHGDRDEGHSEHHRQGIAGAFEAIGAGIRNAFRGLKGYTRSDDRIREDVCDRINHLSERHGMDVSEVEVRVHEGEVTLAGTIDNRQFKHRIENEAAATGGVRNVHNEVRVRQTSLNFEGRSTDPSTSTAATAGSTPASTATATAGALSSGMIGTGGAPSTTERSRVPNGNAPPNGNVPPTR